MPAGDLDWTCRATVAHVADDLFSYASQVIARPVLERLFPDAPQGDPSEVLLHVTGRAALADRPRLTQWAWDSSVRRRRPEIATAVP